MYKIHAVLVTTYMLIGLGLMATTPWSNLQGMLTHGGSTLAMEALHGSADEQVLLAEDVVRTANRAAASRQLMLGVMLFTLGGFLHAYGELRSERPVKVTVKKKKPLTLFWLEMKV